MPAGQEITLRLTIGDPVPGVAYSLQDKKSQPVGAVIAADAPLSFDAPVRVASEAGKAPRFLGAFVRAEGPERRFVYIAIGAQAGQPGMLSRRAKIDIHDIPAGLLDKALVGAVLEARLPGRDAKGDPACATLRPLDGWRAAEV